MNEPKLCINCTHYFDGRPFDRCRHPSNIETDLVDGNAFYKVMSVRVLRDYDHLCGTEGKNFEAKAAAVEPAVKAGWRAVVHRLWGLS